MSVLVARFCAAMYSRLFPCLIILVKSKVKGCCLTSESQISIHSTGKAALKLQKTVTASWTYFSWQFNSSSLTSTNCAQGRDVMNNWCGVVESCSEGEQALEHGEIVHLFSFHPFLPSTINSPPCPWTRNEADTLALVGCRPSALLHSSGAASASASTTPQWTAGVASKSSRPRQHSKERVKDQHNTVATGNKKNSPLLTFSLLLVLEPRSVLSLPPGCSHCWVISPCPELTSLSLKFLSPVQLRWGVTEWLWWPPGIQPRWAHPSPSPTFPSRALVGSMRWAWSSPHHQTQLWAAQGSSTSWFSGSNPQRWSQLNPAGHPTSETGRFPDEFFSSDLQHHLKQAFIIHCNFYCIL